MYIVAALSRVYLIIIFLLPLSNFGSQVQAQYYQSIDPTLEGAALKTALHDLISSNTFSIPYGPSGSYTVIDFMCDYDYANGEVFDRYADTDYTDCYGDRYSTGISPTAVGQGWNREHVFPRSWWGGNTNTPQNSDVHNLFASDAYTNQLKNNYPIGRVSANGSGVSLVGQDLGGCVSGCNSVVFEPADDVKGDLARAMLYMAVRYEDEMSVWENSTCRGDDVLTGQSFEVFEQCYLALLLFWHQNDPPDAAELARNNGAHTVQGNRNPFIDEPLWSATIWGVSDGETITPAGNGGIVSCAITEWQIETISSNSSFNNGGQWTSSGSGYTINAFCGSACAEMAESWLITGPYDIAGLTTLNLKFTAEEQYGDTPIEVYWSDSYNGCPDAPIDQWALLGTLFSASLPQENTAYSVTVDMTPTLGADELTLAFRYADDGADGYNYWRLDNFVWEADSCPIAGAPVVSACDCPMDLDADGFVGIADFILFNSDFGGACAACQSDFNGDGLVDVSDFLLLNSALGTSCP